MDSDSVRDVGVGPAGPPAAVVWVGAEYFLESMLSEVAGNPVWWKLGEPDWKSSNPGRDCNLKYICILYYILIGFFKNIFVGTKNRNDL